MFSNYIKLAWRILGRKKFFTFISLFGISFTLGILMVILSFLQSELGTSKPLTHKEDLILIDDLSLRQQFFDTIPTIDTMMLGGTTTYDTTYEYKSRGAMQWNSSMNNGIAEDYLSNLESVDNQTIFSSDAQFDVFVNNIKLKISGLYGDPAYWDVFDHEIIEGRTFDQKDMDQAAQVVVMSQKTAADYFGSSDEAVGNNLEMDGKKFKVIGLYKSNAKIIPFVCPDIVMPYTNFILENQETFYHGIFSVVLKKKTSASAEKVKDEVKAAAALVPLDHPSKPPGYNEVLFSPMTYNEMYAQGIYYDRKPEKSYQVVKVILLALLLFFIILPTLNLINLNVSRIMERSSEIGVRKAFGAHQNNIIFQFIIENILQTLLGGLIGLVLALSLIGLINKGGYLGNAHLALSPKFFGYSLLVTLIFGVLSGLIPAYKMSKLQIVKALKSNKL